MQPESRRPCSCYGNPDTHFDRDTNFNCSRNSYAERLAEIFTDGETGANAEAASHAATAPVDR